MVSIFFRTILIYILLSLSMKLMGKREIGELEVGELITSLLISELCSIPIDDPDIPLLNAVIPVLLLVSAEIIISSIKNKSAKLKTLVDGEEVFLIKNGKINQQALKQNRISLEEFFATLRQNSIGNIDEVEHCILESNGKISILQKDSALSFIIISDGEILDGTLKKIGLSTEWLTKRLNGTKASDIFLMTVDQNQNTNIIKKDKNR